MKVGTRCLARAIGMSDAKTRASAKQVRKFVGPDFEESYTNHRQESSSYWMPKPVLVKVSAFRDMQRARQAKIQPSLLKSDRNTKAQIFFITVGFFLKSMIVITLLYWVFIDGSLPFFPDIIKIDVPTVEDVKYSFIQRYNHAVLKIIEGLIGAPQRIHKMLMSILARLEKAFENDETDHEKS